MVVVAKTIAVVLVKSIRTSTSTGVVRRVAGREGYLAFLSYSQKVFREVFERVHSLKAFIDRTLVANRSSGGQRRVRARGEINAVHSVALIIPSQPNTQGRQVVTDFHCLPWDNLLGRKVTSHQYFEADPPFSHE